MVSPSIVILRCVSSCIGESPKHHGFLQPVLDNPEGSRLDCIEIDPVETMKFGSQKVQRNLYS